MRSNFSAVCPRRPRDKAKVGGAERPHPRAARRPRRAEDAPLRQEPSRALRTTNALRWTPTSARAGHYSIKIAADDGHGGTASSTVEVDVLFPTIASLPAGAVALKGRVIVPLTNIDFCANSLRHTDCGPWASDARFDCVLAGQNPGKVTITCAGAFYVPHIGYDSSTGGALRYQDVAIDMTANARSMFPVVSCSRT